MSKCCNLILLAAALSWVPAVQSVELSGRFSLFGSVAQAEAGDVGYRDVHDRSLTADQQSLRLMLEEFQAQGEWSVHLKTRRQHQQGYPLNQFNPNELFRYKDLSHEWLDHRDSDSATLVGYEIDRAVYQRNFDKFSVGLGRQAIDWGSGRLWQPLNVFGAFAPTDLDTDFKPGIDSAVVDWYPSAFSSLTVAYVLAPNRLATGERAEIKNSGAVYYKRQVGLRSEMSLLAGSVIDNDVVGASFESDWGGMGWRLEGLYSNPELSTQNTLFWVAGIDYQFAQGTLIAIEWYDNSYGASDEASLVALQLDRQLTYDLQPQRGRRVFGITAQKDLTPLLNANYTILASSLRDAATQSATSLLHQVNLIYSLSNESDLLLSLLYANGKGLTPDGQVQSEYGHIPAGITLRWRYYF